MPPKEPSDVLVTPLGTGGAVLFKIEMRATFTLNASGYRIWELLAEGESLEDVAARLAVEFDVKASSALASVARLHEELSAAGLLPGGQA